jgi:hypothetical protein
MENEQIILVAIETLSKKVDDLQPVKQALRSPQLNELYTALAKAQSEFKVASKSRKGQWGTYEEINDLVAATRPALTKNGLAVKFDIILSDNGQSILNTTLSHSSGQFETTQVRIIPAKGTTQALGEQLTYLQRYTYKCVTGVSLSNDPDDNDTGGEEEEQETRVTPNFLRKPADEKTFEVITKYQLEEIERELDGYTELAEEILTKLKLRSFADLPQNKCEATLKRIREIKSTL